MKGLSGMDDLAIRLMQMGCQSGNARAPRAGRILTQNRHPPLLKAKSVAGFFS
jgi:hypothetical protein